MHTDKHSSFKFNMEESGVSHLPILICVHRCASVVATLYAPAGVVNP
jgi:hypothetical protein